MSVIEYSDIKISLDDEGYLENLDDWKRKVS
jgi:sulfur relay (sulfurtransferase) DsrC/TusE family protein